MEICTLEIDFKIRLKAMENIINMMAQSTEVNESMINKKVKGKNNG